MRTTVTLDPDAEQIVRRRMAEHRQTFKEALNDVIRRGAMPEAEQRPFRTEVASMGHSSVNLDRALAIAGADEDVELLRRLRVGQ